MLGGRGAVAKPLGVGLAGLPAQGMTRGWNLWALRSPGAVSRVATNWVLHGLGASHAVRMGFSTNASGRLAEFEQTDDYLTPEQARAAAVAP